MTQPHLIKRIISTIPGMQKANPRKTPACTTVTLTKDPSGPFMAGEFNYRSIIGMLNYLVNSTHPKLAFSVHQCARYCENPKRSHEQAVKHILKYLLHVSNNDPQHQGLIYRPDASKGIEVFVDASFAGDWSSETSSEPSSVMSRTGYVIKYANCPIVWCSKLQTEIALSTTEAEYIALSQAMRDAVPLTQLIDELRTILPLDPPQTEVKCTIFEDNESCIAIAKSPRLRPRTKHIAIKYHHFRKGVIDGFYNILSIDTLEQTADIFTKALSETKFTYLRRKLNGW